MTDKPPLCDIYNKKIKVCKVCVLPFDTHKLFVDHCHTFHKLRYEVKTRNKTVSGEKRRFREIVQIPMNDAITNNQESIHQKSVLKTKPHRRNTKLTLEF